MSDEKVTTVKVGGKEYELIKTGFAQAQQVSALAGWFGQHGQPLFAGLGKAQEKDAGTAETLLAALGSVSPEALVGLFDVVVGCGPKDAREHFDLEILIDGIMGFFENPAIRRVIERFFSSNEQSDQTENSSTT